MAAKKKYSDIKEAFEERGWKLLSTTYENSSSRLYFECGFGHRHYITWDRFKQKPTCRICSGIGTVVEGNKLSDLFPELEAEWDYEANSHEYHNNKKHPKLPEEVSYGSSKAVWWVCSICGYTWRAKVSCRVGRKGRKGTGCPSCAGKVVSDTNRLSTRFPLISSEWDFEKNFPLEPKDVSYGSGKRVWWLCGKCGGRWKVVVKSRTACLSDSLGCPECRILSGHKKRRGTLLSKSNLVCVFPEVAAEWHCEKNFPLKAEDVPFGSRKVVWWKCGVCSNEWRTSVNNRTRPVRTGCPLCAVKKNGKACSMRASERNNLLSKRPDLSGEWDYEKNFPYRPEHFSCFSQKVVWWKCHKCSFEWEAVIRNRNRLEAGCVECTRVVQGVNRTAFCVETNNLLVRNPYLSEEWDYEKNFPRCPEHYSRGKQEKVWWVCRDCRYSWKATVASRNGGRGCPKCASGPVSKASQEWLDILGVPQKNREVWFPNLGIRVDAYAPETNTVYEFLGDYWHGNPNKFDQDDVHPTRGVTFGQLFDETIERLFLLRQSGYNLNVIWEKDFEK